MRLGAFGLTPALFSIVATHKPATADIVNDGLAVGQLIIYNSPVGQTFTASDPSIYSIGVGIVGLNPAAPEQARATVTVRLRLGDSIAGSLLAEATALPDPQLNEDWTDFVFDPPVSVDIGEKYTFEVVDATYQWGIWLDDNFLDSYPDGYVWLSGAHPPWERRDMRFRVLAAERPGVCCSMDQCLQDVSKLECDAIEGGVHLGTGSYCSNVNCVRSACCSRVLGACTMFVKRQCDLAFSILQPGIPCGESSCDLIGDCCVGDECIDSQARSVCEDAGGTLFGIDTCGYYQCPICPDMDIDHDSDYDLLEVWAMQNCLGLSPAFICACADFDGDRSIGLLDLSIFVTLLTGPDQ